MLLRLIFRHSHASSWHCSVVNWVCQDSLSGNTMSWRPNGNNCGKNEAHEKILQPEYTVNYYFPCSVFIEPHSWSSCHQCLQSMLHMLKKKIIENLPKNKFRHSCGERTLKVYTAYRIKPKFLHMPYVDRPSPISHVHFPPLPFMNSAFLPYGSLNYLPRNLYSVRTLPRTYYSLHLE